MRSVKARYELLSTVYEFVHPSRRGGIDLIKDKFVQLEGPPIRVRNPRSARPMIKLQNFSRQFRICSCYVVLVPRLHDKDQRMLRSDCTRELSCNMTL